MCRRVGFILLLASAKELRLHLRAVGQGAKGNSHVHGADVEVTAEQGREKEEGEREGRRGERKTKRGPKTQSGKTGRGRKILSEFKENREHI